MRLWMVIVLAVCGWGAYDAYTSRERHHPPGQIAPNPPVQKTLTRAAPIPYGDSSEFTLFPRAKFELEARLLARERYRADAGASLMPIDMAFGWADMSDTALIKQLSISQSGRFYFWQYQGDPPAAHDVIIRSSANMHMIPASKAVEKTLFAARVGDVVLIEGELVDAKRRDGWHIATSLSREDSGAGACEVIYVRSASIRP
jgi:hypothetical protein